MKAYQIEIDINGTVTLDSLQAMSSTELKEWFVKPKNYLDCLTMSEFQHKLNADMIDTSNTWWIFV